MASTATVDRALLPVFNQSRSLVSFSVLPRGQLLALAPESRGILILDKGFYSDFATAGAGLGGPFDRNCIAIYPAGSIRFFAPETRSQRLLAFQKRIDNANDLQQILLDKSPLRRAYLILRHLSQSLGIRETQNIPYELVAHLVGVTPKDVAAVWHRYRVRQSRMKHEG